MRNQAITRLPASEALKALQEERDWSIRDLSRHLNDRFPGWGSPALLSDYRTGKQRMSPLALERIAAVLNVPPETFAEYRLAVARAELDPEQVGLQIALKNLERFDR